MYAQNPGVVATDTYIPDALVAGHAPPLVTATGTIISGQTLTRGAVLGKITASGKYNLCLAAASDGSQIPNAILANDTDASGGDVLGPVYLAGSFNTRSMTFGAGTTATNAFDALRDAGIFLVTSQSATPV